MTTEEKAKAYDEALKKASDYYEKGYFIINAALVNIFPELAEDENERRRKDPKRPSPPSSTRLADASRGTATRGCSLIVKEIEHKAKEIANQWQEPSDYNIARDAATEMAEWLLSHQWVSVEDELPPLEKKVLVKHKYGFQTAARFPYYDIRPDETFWGLNSEIPIGADITHWMPIPPLAEEGGEK